MNLALPIVAAFMTLVAVYKRKHAMCYTTCYLIVLYYVYIM